MKHNRVRGGRISRYCMHVVLVVLMAAGLAGCVEVSQSLQDDILNAAGSRRGLTEGEIIRGLKAALVKSVRVSTSQLGKTNGFLKRPEVKIPMPEKLQKVEEVLRTMGQDKMADDFIRSMNRAAEKAVPGTFDIFAGVIKNMTFEEAGEILKGPDDAATQFFETNSRSRIKTKIMPIIQDATQRTNVTGYYKRITSTVRPFLGALGMEVRDLDDYVAEKAMDGLFLFIAKEEKKIRTDPVARTSEILKKVFGSLDN